MPGLLGIDHIAVAVEDLEAATALWRDALGLRVGEREVVADQGVEVQMLYAGGTRIELMRSLQPDSPVGRFLQKRGPGLHHLALAVERVEAVLEGVKERGLRVIDASPRAGAHGTRIAFLHPSATGGVLTELVEGGRNEP